MARWLPIDKPAGYTSHDVVAQVRKRLGLKRVGHSGTLDPAVTGVLLVAVGGATRLIQYLPSDKTYRGIIRLGITTHSQDASGTITQEQPVPSFSTQDIETALNHFRGSIQQVPPMVSAVSWQGQRLHELARAGIDIPNRPARPVTIHELVLERIELPDVWVSVRCSAGTYIRTLAHDLGQQLGCGAHLLQLRRTEANGISDQHLLSLDELEPLTVNGEPGLAADVPLQYIPRLDLPETEILRLLQGQILPHTVSEPLYRIYHADTLAALAGPWNEGLKAKLVLQPYQKL